MASAAEALADHKMAFAAFAQQMAWPALYEEPELYWFEMSVPRDLFNNGERGRGLTRRQRVAIWKVLGDYRAARASSWSTNKSCCRSTIGP